MTTTITSYQENDCVPVALSNYFGIEYSEVRKELEEIGKTLGYNYPTKSGGCPGIVHDTFLIKHGMVKREKTPRRGQEKITGILVMMNASKTYGHMVIVLDGIVFDKIAPEGMPIKEYQRRFSVWSVNAVWE